jgi:hypothetical protein
VLFSCEGGELTMAKIEGLSDEAQAAFDAGDVKNFIQALAGPDKEKIAKEKAAAERQKQAEIDYDIVAAVMESRGTAAGIRALVRLRDLSDTVERLEGMVKAVNE